MPDTTKLSKLQAADFALFAAACWPKASWDEYLVITYLVIWLFVWDDEIDTAVGDLSSNLAAAESFRHETILSVTQSLGFGQDAEPPEEPSPIINSFEAIASPLRKFYTKGMLGRSSGTVLFQHIHHKDDSIADMLVSGQLQSLLDEIIFFVEMSQVEQQYRLCDKVPNLEEYWAYRTGTIAVGPCMALIE